MNEDQTTAAVQRYLDGLADLSGHAPAEPLIRALVERSVDRLNLLCGKMLLRSYPRLARPPMNLQIDELLSAVVERLLKALQEVRPSSVRQFFALANRHMRWELNDLARRLDLDKERHARKLGDVAVAISESSESQLSPNARRILDAVESLPEEEREVFELMRIQNLTQTEVMGILEVSASTLQRRLKRCLLLLTERLSDLEPSFAPPKGE
jgi:RNA polymerase sigma factor (sigma-70 family)